MNASQWKKKKGDARDELSAGRSAATTQSEIIINNHEAYAKNNNDTDCGQRKLCKPTNKSYYPQSVFLFHFSSRKIPLCR